MWTRTVAMALLLSGCFGDPGGDTDTDTDTDTTVVRDLCGTACAGTCTALPAPDGNRYCVDPPDPWMEACDGESACCADTDCGTGGQCAAFSWGYCGGAPPPAYNVCHTPECTTDADCGANRACLPPGAFGFDVARCVDAPCRSDADCTDRVGGECRPLNTGDCARVGTFHCTYGDDPCRSDEDCTGASVPQRCVPQGATTVCQDNPPRP